ncbi:hypothetical protein TWF281_010858 [Arthrobotrys megalospora]
MLKSRLAGLASVLSFFFGNAFAIPAGSTGSVESGILGWNSELEDKYEESTNDFLFSIIPKREYWKNEQVIDEIALLIIEKLSENLDKDQDGDSEQPEGRVYTPKYRDVGTPFILFRAKFGIVPTLVHEDYNKIDAGERIGAAEYIDTWGIVSAEEEIDQQKIRPMDIALWTKRRNRRSSPGDPKGSRLDMDIDQKRKNNGNSQWRRELGDQNITTGEGYSRRKVLQKRSLLEYRFDKGIPSDLRYYSKPPGTTSDKWESEPVYYEDSEGEGIDIFVLDNGFTSAATEHDQFKDAIQNNQIKGWLFAGGVQEGRNHDEILSKDDATKSDFHGTEVISKIIGRRTGFARKANIWVASCPDYEGVCWTFYYIDLLFKILEKIDEETEQDPNYKAIINLSVVLDIHRIGKELDDYTAMTTQGERKYIEAYSQIADIVLEMLGKRKNVIIVTGTGNDWVDRPVFDWPAKRGSSIKNMVVVGSVDENSEINSLSEADFVKVYALSTGITVPSFTVDQAGKQVPKMDGSETAFKQTAGISFANPIVCSILATQLSAHPNWSMQQAIDKLYSDAYPRLSGPNALKIVWTGTSPAACGPGSSGTRKRSLGHHNDINRREECPDIEEDTGAEGEYSATSTVLVEVKTVDVTVTITETTRVARATDAARRVIM